MTKFRILILLTIIISAFFSCPLLEVETDEGDKDSLLVVVNTSGSSSGSGEPTGSIPFSVIDTTELVSRNNVPVGPKMLKDGFKNDDNVAGSRSGMPMVTSRAAGVNYLTDSYDFYAVDNDWNNITVTATLRYGSDISKCLIFVENGYESDHNWAAIGQYFDYEIYVKDKDVFGMPTDVDGNGQIVILYYAVIGNEYLLGYFWSGDLDPGGTSNEMEIFYMNINWGNPAGNYMMRTLAHEFQHLINFGQRVILNSKTRMDSWMDEGLAESAEDIVFGEPGYSRITTMNNDTDGLIRNGLPLCVWPDMNSLNDENYSLSYTFMQYCRIHSTNGTGIFKSLIDHTYPDYRAVEAIMSVENTSFTSFSRLLRSYRLANLLNHETGIYGYKEDNNIFNMTVRPPSTRLSSIDLKPGGCLYVKGTETQVKKFVPYNAGTHIEYERVIKNVLLEE